MKPDRALPLDIDFWCIGGKLEHYYHTSDEHYAVAIEGSVYIFPYCCALRGEEFPCADLYGIASHWKEAQDHPTKHVVIALLHWFKGETGENYHLMQIVDTTH